MKKLFLLVAFCMGVIMAFAQDEKTAIDLKNEGNDALREKDYKKALELYEQSMAKWEGDQDTAMVYNSAFCAFKVKEFDKAIQYFDKSIALDYKKQTAMLYKANVYKAQDKEEEYVKTLEEALAAFPDDDKVSGMLATYYLKEGNTFYKAGAAILKGAADDVTAGKYKTTDEQYKQATEKAKAEFKKALPLIEKALKYDPDNATGKQLKTACEQNING
jgi:tetratricopeptide (TPR) repeat protein